MKKFLTEEQRQMFLDALEQAEGKKVIYIDMDGVIANFDKGAETWGSKIGLTAKEFIDKKLYRSSKFYYELELIEGAKEAIEELDKYFDVRLLSAPSWGNPDSFTEKRLWVEEHLGEWSRKRMDLSFRKDRSIGHFLVDDRTKYGAGNFFGEHVMYGTEPFHNWKSVVEYLLSKK